MSARIRNAFFGIISVVGLLVTGQARAVIITGSGIDTTARHFVIDGTVSSVTHNPGFSFGGAPTQTYAVSGEFDASFSRYWWSYFLDGDVHGTQGTFIFQENWLTFSNPHLIWTDDPGGFAFPNYFVRVNGANLFGDEGACNFPFGPDMYCSGWTNGPIASLTGTVENGRLSLQGSMPVLGGNLFENFVYDIQTNAIPEPGMLPLILSGLAGLLFTKRRRQLRS